VLVAGGLSFAAVGAGLLHTCGLATTGAAYCWGFNYGGQLGTGASAGPEQCQDGAPYPCSTVPVAVAGRLTFATVSVGLGHTCGLTAAGAARCWGLNTEGRLGDGTTTDRASPVPVAGGLSFSAVSAGYYHTCGLTAAGAAYCWGYNAGGQLGDRTSTDRASPVLVAGGLSFAAVSVGGAHTCGVTPAGAAYCWGANEFGQLGNGDTATAWALTPVPVAGGLTFATLSASFLSTCGVTTAGVAYCWGYNWDGELGDGTTTSSNVPVKVAGQR
jgi:alpha-tubulin suppressor-like RCC1 family protein